MKVVPKFMSLIL